MRYRFGLTALLFVVTPALAKDCIDRYVAQARAVSARLDRTLSTPLAGLSIAKAAARLKAMGEADQAVLTPLLEGAAKCKRDLNDPSLRQRFGASVRHVRETNLAAFRAFFQKSGWPSIDRYGEDADQAAFLIVQHADDDVAFQQAMLAAIGPLAEAGKTAPSQYALLYDRVQVNQGRPQRFGTQGDCQQGQWKPNPVDAPQDLDALRVRYRLPPMAEYAASNTAMYCR